MGRGGRREPVDRGLAGLYCRFCGLQQPRGDNANLFIAVGDLFLTGHALAIIGLGGLGWLRDLVAWLFFYGILLSSGSL